MVRDRDSKPTAAGKLYTILYIKKEEVKVSLFTGGINKENPKNSTKL
jgi:hypothetical protein